MPISLMNDMGLNQKVFPDKLCRINRIRQNSPDAGGRQHHVVRSFLTKELPHCLLVKQIEFSAGASYKISKSSSLQTADDCRTNQTAVASNKD